MLNKTIFRFFHPLWRLYDALIPKRPDHWAFATHHLHSGRFIENQRALFEYIKADPDIRKIIFYRGAASDFQIDEAVNYEIVEHGTLRSLALLARCKVVLLTHSISMDFSLRWGDKTFSILKLAMKNRVVVNLWHSISLKRLLYATNEETRLHTDRVKYRTQERRAYAGLIASSDIDSYAMSTMFYPLNYHQVWLTGLPRNDFLTQDDSRLPRYIRDSLQLVRQIRQGKKFILYAPTYRQTEVSSSAYYYQFSDDEIENLKTTLRAHNAILGYRPHYFKNSSSYFNLDRYVDNDLIFDVSQAIVPEFSALARECDLLITDYSSVYIETLYLGKPVICFGYDIEHYMTQQDGLLYDMSLVFPGPVVKSFHELIAAISAKIELSRIDIEQEQAVAKKIFFKYDDNLNSQRVCERILQLVENNKIVATKKINENK